MGTNAQRQAKHHSGSESGTLTQHASGVANVAGNALDKIHSAHLPAFLLDLCEATDRSARGTWRLLGCHACGKVFLDLLLQVKAELVGHFLFDSRSNSDRSRSPILST